MKIAFTIVVAWAALSALAGVAWRVACAREWIGFDDRH